MNEKTKCVFAIYKDGEFQGFRADTFNTMFMDRAKIYTYTKEQVETCIGNIESYLKKQSSLGRLLGVPIIERVEKAIYEKMTALRGFEVRVLKGPTPIYEKNFNVETAQYETEHFPSYEGEELNKLLTCPDEAEVLETHFLCLEGRLNLS